MVAFSMRGQGFGSVLVQKFESVLSSQRTTGAFYHHFSNMINAWTVFETVLETHMAAKIICSTRGPLKAN